MPATLTVLNANDSGLGSLREAIELANGVPGPDSIGFAPSGIGTITLSGALPVLSSDITMAGPGASALTVARSAAPGTPSFRIFEVAAGADVKLSGLTLSGGELPTFPGGRGEGGGIYNAGTLSIRNVTVGNNTVLQGFGGGIYNAGTMSIVDSTIDRNRTVFSGGGIWNETGASLTIINSTISENSTTSFGGGIFNNGTLAITNSTLSGNSTGAGGGGILNGSGGRLTIMGSTLRGTSAIDGPGGISNVGALTVRNSIFENPLGGNIGSFFASNPLPPGPFTSGGHNLFSDRPAITLDPTDLVNTDPLLGPLADNGGPTFTHALLPGSPAIDAGLAVAGVTADQRGVLRPQGGAPDIGAFESRGFTLAVVRGDAQETPVGSAFPVPLVVRVASPSGEPVAGGRVSFAAPPTGGSAALDAEPASIDADGLAAVDATAIGAGGTYAVTARSTGANSVVFLLANRDVAPPTVVALRRFGYRFRRTSLVLTFSKELDATRAQDPGNYELSVRGRPRRPIRVRSARYDSSANAVTLEPARRLPLSLSLVLTVNGTAPDGLTSTSGIPLAGRGDGQAGTDFVARVDRMSPVLPTSPRAGERDRPGTGSQP